MEEDSSSNCIIIKKYEKVVETMVDSKGLLIRCILYILISKGWCRCWRSKTTFSLLVDLSSGTLPKLVVKREADLLSCWGKLVINLNMWITWFHLLPIEFDGKAKQQVLYIQGQRECRSKHWKLLNSLTHGSIRGNKQFQNITADISKIFYILKWFLNLVTYLRQTLL